MHLMGYGLDLAGCLFWLPQVWSWGDNLPKSHITWMAAASDTMVHSVL